MLTAKEIYDEVVDGFGNRKFAAGLAVTFIDFLQELGVPRDDVSNLSDFLAAYPRREFRSIGKRANTLIVDRPDGRTLSIRPFYNKVENFFRAENHRFDYPNCAPHATQAWRDYERWLDGLCGCSKEDLIKLRDDICDFVLAELPSQAFDPSTLDREQPVFGSILDDFDLVRQKGEPHGAAYQGLVFGFLRADNPHLQVEIDKVGAGGKRLQRVGDVDAWEGARLAITAEVKQYVLTDDHVGQFAGFANAAVSRGSIGLVCSLGFEEGVRRKVESLGVRALDIEDLRSIVSLWDPMKQRTAAASLMYYVKHVEKNSALGTRLDEFIAASV